jgi:cytochrome c-type biogenesis protein CcmF
MTPAVFLMGIGPIARWKKADLPELATRLRWSFGVSLATALLLPVALGKSTFLINLGLLLAIWIVTTAVVNLRERLIHVVGDGLMGRLASLPRSYWGMTLAHCGVAVFIVGVTLVKGYEMEKDLRMNVGETATIGGYRFRFDGVQELKGPNYMAARGRFHVSKDGREVSQMFPEKRLYSVQGQTMTEAAIDSGLFRDLYVSLGEPLDGGAWSVRLYHKPFVDWIWGGCLLLALGGGLAVTDRRYRFAWRKEQDTVSAAPQAVGQKVA